MAATQAVRTIHTIAELASCCEPGDTIYLDLDETLLVPEPDASEAWAKHFAEALEAGGVPTGGAAWAAAWRASSQLQCSSRP